MKEHKFRLRDIENNCWVQPTWGGSICVGDQAIVIIDYEPNKNGGYSPKLIRMLTWDEMRKVEINQYTEVKDFNNKELYQRDIVEDEDGHRYLIVWDQENKGFYLRQQGTIIGVYFNVFKRKDGRYQLTYIGNLYDTPELWEGEPDKKVEGDAND